MPKAGNKTIYIQNSTERPFYVLLHVGAGRRLQIHLFIGPYSNAVRVDPGLAVTFPIDRKVKRCQRKNGKFQFEIINRTKREIALEVHPALMPDGPTYEFLSNAN